VSAGELDPTAPTVDPVKSSATSTPGAAYEDERLEAAAVLSRRACQPDCDQHPGHVYVICYGQPTVTSYSERDWHPDDSRTEAGNYPISHYVGWTRQHPPVRRVRQHGARSARFIAKIIPGTPYDETVAKVFGACPTCGQSLDYYAEAPHRLGHRSGG
jgi:hypothetical protein